MVHINTHLAYLYLVARQPALPLHRVYQICAENATTNHTTRSSSSIGNATHDAFRKFPPLVQLLPSAPFSYFSQVIAYGELTRSHFGERPRNFSVDEYSGSSIIFPNTFSAMASGAKKAIPTREGTIAILGHTSLPLSYMA